jgi:hypothetical protein
MHGSPRRVPAAPEDHHKASSVDRDGRESLDEEIDGGGRRLLRPLGTEEEGARKRKKQAREGREEDAAGDLIPSEEAVGGAVHLLAWIDGECAARQLLADRRKTTTRGAGLGPGWAATGCVVWQISEREGRSWAGFGQERKREIFFYTLFSISVSLFSKLLHSLNLLRSVKPLYNL